MQSTIQIIKTLTVLLRNNFPDIPMNDTDIEEGFVRPSFFIDILNIESDRIGEYLNDFHTVKLYYFAKDINEGYLDLLKIKNELRILLADNIRFGDMNEDGSEQDGYRFVIGADSIIFTVSQKDKTLQCEFVIQTVQEDERDDGVETVNEIDFTLTTDAGSTNGNLTTAEVNDESYEGDFIGKLKE